MLVIDSCSSGVVVRGRCQCGCGILMRETVVGEMLVECFAGDVCGDN